MDIAQAIPPTTDPTWQEIVTSADYTVDLLVPTTLVNDLTLSPGTEGNAFPTQPKFKFTNNGVSFNPFNPTDCFRSFQQQ